MTYLGDHLQDRVDLIQRLLNAHSQLTSKLLVSLELLALLNLLGCLCWLWFRLRFCFWLGRDVLEKSNVADDLILLIVDIAIFINLLTSALCDVAICKFCDNVTYQALAL